MSKGSQGFVCGLCSNVPALTATVQSSRSLTPPNHENYGICSTTICSIINPIPCNSCLNVTYSTCSAVSVNDTLFSWTCPVRDPLLPILWLSITHYPLQSTSPPSPPLPPNMIHREGNHIPPSSSVQLRLLRTLCKMHPLMKIGPPSTRATEEMGMSDLYPINRPELHQNL